MKKVIIAFVSGVVISMSSVAVAATQFNVSLFPSEFIFNGVNKPVPSEYEVFNYNGHVYVPIRYVTESMGATVGFTASPDNKPNQISIDYKAVSKNSDNPSGYADSEKNKRLIS
ncbi:stalk domain-containing protein [Paenibacillus sp. RC67]|uniref:stalk domain-containing protein n=1 Tax=Paenibacillus sp. RC67 TaxID=3039392 RepID=UPI0024AD465E|nr:stalk domain-containing protein [Paenibacillus sp. RC67]